MTIYVNVIKRIFLLFFVFTISTSIFAQEWKNLKAYQKSTGQETLAKGHWLKKDRKRNTQQWQNANLYHLEREKGYEAYTTIKQRRDFYKWFDEWQTQQGHELQWVGAAYIVAGQFANTETWFVRTFVIRNVDILNFAQQGNQAILNDVYPELQKIYQSDILLTGEAATKWDSEYGYREQCVIIESFYEQQDEKVIQKLDKMATGKGIFRFVVPKSIRFQGDITNCEDRYKHGKEVLPLYYQQHKNSELYAITMESKKR